MREPDVGLCEVSEHESDDNGCEGAFSGANDMTGVDGHFDVAGVGSNNCAVDATRRVRITAKIGQWIQKVPRVSKTYPDPEGPPEIPEGMLVGIACVFVLVLVLLPGTSEGPAVMYEMRVCV